MIKKIAFLLCFSFLVIGCSRASNDIHNQVTQDIKEESTQSSIDYPTSTLEVTEIDIPDISIEYIKNFVQLQKFGYLGWDRYLVSPNGKMIAIRRSLELSVYSLPDLTLKFTIDSGEEISDLSWSSDSIYLAIRLNINVIEIRETDRGEIKKEIDLYETSMYQKAPSPSAPMSWSPDGSQLFAGGIVWNTNSWQPEFVIESDSGILWSPKNDAISTDFLIVWKSWTRTGEENDIEFVGVPYELNWSPNGEFIAGELVSTTANNFTIWNPVSGEILLSEYFSDEVSGILWSPDNTYLAIGFVTEEDLDRVELIETSTGTKYVDFEVQVLHNEIYQSSIVMAWSKDGSLLATGHDDGYIRIWDPYQGKLEKEFKAHLSSVRQLYWSEGKEIVSDGDGDIKIWNATSGKLIESVLGFRLLPSISWSLDSSRIMVGTHIRTYIWNVESEKIEVVLENPVDTGRIDWAENGSDIAFSEKFTDRIIVWSLDNGESEYYLGLKVYKEFAWVPGKQWLSASGGPEVVIWDINSGETIYHFENDCWVDKLSWSNDGNKLAFTDAWGRIHVLDMHFNRTNTIVDLLSEDGYIRSIDLSPDGSFIASNGTPVLDHKKLIIYDAITGEEFGSIEGNITFDWSPDGNWIASTTDDLNQVSIWSFPELEEVSIIPGQSGGLERMKWSPNGLYIATIGWDDTLRVWGLESE